MKPAAHQGLRVHPSALSYLRLRSYGAWIRHVSKHQTGIIDDLPPVARYLSFHIRPDGDINASLGWLSGLTWGGEAVLGIGAATAAAVGAQIEGLREPTAMSGPGVSVPATPSALWLWLRDSDRGELVHRARAMQDGLRAGFELEDSVDAFTYRGNRDLSGYEDGTENPKDQAALDAAICDREGPGRDGASFVAVQTWVHDLSLFNKMSETERDHTIGRRISDNEEIDEAPPSAHVKRTAQESFQPEAFVLRRSMPWSDAQREGLVFVAFGRRFDAFEALLGRMMGAEDGITDNLLKFTRPVQSRYFWCPPVKQGRLDLSALLPPTP